MLKKLWIFLTEDDHHAKSHAKGFVILLLLSSLILVSPLVWHHFFTPDAFKDDEQKNLALIKEEYRAYCDSVDANSYEDRMRAYKRQEPYFNGAVTQKSTKTYSPHVKRSSKEGNESHQEGYLISGSREYKDSTPYTFHAKKEKVKFSLNAVTAEELKQVRGIGDSYSRRIIKFREKLGGFYSSQQLYEVYGLDSSVVGECMLYLTDEDLSVTRKILINKAEFKSILKHPYLDYDDVKAVFKYRPLTNGKLCKVFPLKCEKLKPYMQY